jgi:hypothetical protein
MTAAQACLVFARYTCASYAYVSLPVLLFLGSGFEWHVMKVIWLTSLTRSVMHNLHASAQHIHV